SLMPVLLPVHLCSTVGAVGPFPPRFKSFFPGSRDLAAGATQIVFQAGAWICAFVLNPSPVPHRGNVGGGHIVNFCHDFNCVVSEGFIFIWIVQPILNKLFNSRPLDVLSHPAPSLSVQCFSPPVIKSWVFMGIEIEPVKVVKIIIAHLEPIKAKLFLAIQLTVNENPICPR